MLKRLKCRIYAIMEGLPEGGPAGKAFGYFFMTLVILNILAVILETEPALDQGKWVQGFDWFERVSVYIFSVEYLTRLWTCTCNPKYSRPVIGRLRFIFSFMALVDLLAVLPFYLPMVVSLRGVDTRFIRILRLFRLFRVFKLGRYSEAFKTFAKVFKEKREELLTVVFIIAVSLLVISCLMYHVEREAQPDKFSSIFTTMWWGVATLTTVGYGDIYPVTGLGKILSSIIAVLGIGIFALPTGILASGFADEIRKKHEKPSVCPHCGQEIEH